MAFTILTLDEPVSVLVVFKGESAQTDPQKASNCFQQNKDNVIMYPAQPLDSTS